MDMLAAQNRELAGNPPADHFVAMYFTAKKWWNPPERDDETGEESEPELWDSGLPSETA